jgi:hypothetical protein
MFLDNIVTLDIDSVEVIKNKAKKEVKYRLQRAQDGYADADLWNFDSYLAQILCNGLSDFSDRCHAYPSEFSSKEEWQELLEEMRDGFCFYNEHKYDFSNDGQEEWIAKQENMNKRLKKSFKLLRKYFQNLWW